VEVKNQAEALVYSIDKTIKDFGDKITKDQIADIEKEKNELKDLIKNNETEKLKKKIEDINKKIHEVSTKMYQEAMKQEQESKDGEIKDKKKGKKVVDAEVIDDEDEK
jgi:molecular chaperone DnaK